MKNYIDALHRLPDAIAVSDVAAEDFHVVAGSHAV
jgi:hypothetical protein